MPMRTRFLASVTSLTEARTAVRHGADIIDLKDPGAGALGALDPGIVAEVVAGLDNRQLLSATIGDMPLEPRVIRRAVVQTAARGVDIVKMGWFSDRLDGAMLPILQHVTAEGIKVVVVLFAEYGPQLGYLPELAATGIHGVMLDTCNKYTGNLRDKLPAQALHDFIRTARANELVCGLAGSLRHSDIQPLLGLAPDYLGFRGALCSASDRTAGLDAAAVESVRLAICNVPDSAGPDFTGQELSNMAM